MEIMRTIARPEYSILLNGPIEVGRKLCGFKRAEIPDRILPLDQLRPLSKREDWPARPGIYFLWQGPRLSYVGLSRNLNARINRHIDCQRGDLRGKVIPFNKTSWIECDESKVASLEGDYIRAYWPPYNDKP